MSLDHEGQRVSRRTVFAGIGSIGLATLLSACSDEGASAQVTTSTGSTATITPTTATGDLASLFPGDSACAPTREAAQGPYYFDADKIRSDIREDRQGARLRMAIKVQDVESCRPIPNAVVEIWHCDAHGVYSGFEVQSAGTGGVANWNGGDATPQDDERYLRGAQVTGVNGIVEFTTIYPGWYRRRTVHIHAMVHVSNKRVLTTQTMFEEALTTEVYKAAPYSGHTGRDTFNDNDPIFEPSMITKTVEDGEGYLGVITFAVRATG
ncbi:intradiol ring-cleavage dioxygenase [Nonomuraea sp. NPDC049152]|uniref:intradiol ring-cleavage dioxygenase n=1 Tax=Nonomuraea sp. NPDC049152 TaxID=3154350 RepID=UPI003410A428